jgi:hypothetical protein
MLGVVERPHGGLRTGAIFEEVKGGRDEVYKNSPAREEGLAPSIHPHLLGI